MQVPRKPTYTQDVRIGAFNIRRFGVKKFDDEFAINNLLRVLLISILFLFLFYLFKYVATYVFILCRFIVAGLELLKIFMFLIFIYEH